MTNEEINELIAVHVAGYPSLHEPGIDQAEYERRRKRFHQEYSTDIELAMSLLPVTGFFGYSLEYRQKSMSGWPSPYRCKLVSSSKHSDRGTIVAHADSAPMAICIAALKAVGALPKD